MNEHRPEDLVAAMREWADSLNPEHYQGTVHLLRKGADEIERLRETLACPRLTPDAPAEQFQAVLRDHDKGQPVNAQDLVNALMWRVRNQRHEIAKLHERLRRKQSDEAPSFSPNFDERNGIR